MARIGTVVVGLLVILAIVIIGGTLDGVVSDSGSPGKESEIGGTPLPNATGEFGSTDIPTLPTWFGEGVAALLLVVMIAYAIANPEQAFNLLKRYAALFLLVAVIFWALQNLDLDLFGKQFGFAFDSGSMFAGGGGSQSESVTPTVDPTVGVFAVLVAIGLAAIVAVYFASGDSITPADQEGGGAGDRGGITGAVGRVAGRAADRIETSDADVENEVYRAWREMTTLLDVEDPDTSTPEEFAAAAREVGMNDADVSELTDLFRDVRYGEAAPDPDREERAIGALRRIESTYGDESAGSDTGRPASTPGDR